MTKKLPSGRHGNSPEFVKSHQSGRLFLATAECLAEGPFEVTIKSISARASVSRRTFYDLFDNREHAIRACLDNGVDELVGAMKEAGGDPRLAPEVAIEAGLDVLLRFVSAQPDLMKAMVVAAPSADAEAYVEGMERIGRLLPYDERARELVTGGVAHMLDKHFKHGAAIDRQGLIYFACLPLV